MEAGRRTSADVRTSMCAVRMCLHTSTRQWAHWRKAPSIVTLHPATLDQYIRTVDALAAVLADHAGAEDDCRSLFGSFRALVHSITIHPNGPREGFEIGVKGKLATLIGGEVFPEAIRSGAGQGIGGSGRALPSFPTRPKSAIFPPIVRLKSEKYRR